VTKPKSQGQDLKTQVRRSRPLSIRLEQKWRYRYKFSRNGLERRSGTSSWRSTISNWRSTTWIKHSSIFLYPPEWCCVAVHADSLTVASIVESTYLFNNNFDDARRLMKQPKLAAIIQSRQLTLFGHIMRTDDNADAKSILLASPLADWRRQLGRPRITWLSTVQQDLKHHHLTLPEAADLAQNRPLWRMMSTYGATQS